MAHSEIIGTTKSGKSYLAKSIAKRVHNAGRAVFVLDPWMYPDWDCSWKTKDPDTFLARAKDSTGCLLIVDECGRTVGRGNQARKMEWLLTEARHLGHRTILCMQRATQIEPIFHDNIEELFLFNVTPSSAEILVESYCDQELLKASALPKRWFYHKRRLEPALLCKPIPAL